MEHIFKQGTNPHRPTLLFLHGTGGNETDLLPIAQMVDSESAVLSLRGDVLENGMPRFFKRLAEGVFDEEDLVMRTKILNDNLDLWAQKYRFNRHNMVAIGYSNGANMIASLLFHFKNSLKGAILHHPIVPLRGVDPPALTTDVFIGAGTNDPICSSEESKELRGILERAGASVEVHWESNGHRLTPSEIEAACHWYKKYFTKI